MHDRRLGGTVFTWLLVGFVLIATHLSAAEPEDVLVADFERADYGSWQVEGTAFGPGPAAGSLPGQMAVSGYQGQRLVNSFYGGDGSTGRLTSPAFTIERPYLNFLIGGGGHEQTCIHLLVEGKVVRSASGPNTEPGGSERLAWKTWDVQEFAGRSAQLQIIDEHTGGWGHINVDHIVQSDKRWEAQPRTRQWLVDRSYLHWPVQQGADKRRVKVVVDGQVVREFEVELAQSEPDFWAFLDVSAWKGKSLEVTAAVPDDSRGWDLIALADQLPSETELYREKLRPQYHFTSRRGWLNDPNGLVYHAGKYHLFYQHNPYGWNWGNMHWGHAVSRDLLHWQEQPIALYPRQYGDWAFSGSAVVDHQNTSGFGSGDEPPLVLVYTSTGRGECLAYSTDGGHSFVEYSGNPVVRHPGRDPKVIWHEPTKRWIMAVYDEEGGEQAIAFYSSADLKQWQYESRVGGFFECPDLFELALQEDPNTRQWVLYGADGRYLLGSFDGHAFQAESGKHTLWHGNFYAAQTFSDTPDQRRIQIGWGRGIEFPGMPFNQQMTIPVELSLRATDQGPRLFAEPVRELESLRTRSQKWSEMSLSPEAQLVTDQLGSLLDVSMQVALGHAERISFEIRGVPLVYEVARQELRVRDATAAVAAEDGQLRLRVLIDRGSIEVFANRGAVAVSVGGPVSEDDARLIVRAQGEGARLVSLDVHELKSMWGREE